MSELVFFTEWKIGIPNALQEICRKRPIVFWLSSSLGPFSPLSRQLGQLQLTPPFISLCFFTLHVPDYQPTYLACLPTLAAKGDCMSVDPSHMTAKKPGILPFTCSMPNAQPSFPNHASLPRSSYLTFPHKNIQLVVTLSTYVTCSKPNTHTSP